ncbi:MAG: aminopeptidase [Candidatus Delongbacteria bacterium]|jgi:aminopeptidase|nr:aminopeptidase [Candidatus Delongbacteria bacterium]
MDFKQFYSEINAPILDSYEKNIVLIKEISEKLSAAANEDKFKTFMKKCAEHIIFFYDHEKRLNDDFFKNNSFEELQKIFNGFSEEILPENYGTSYANPAYSVEVFGKDIGQVLYVLYQKYRSYRTNAFEHKIFTMDKYNKLFLEIFNLINENSDVDPLELKNIVKRYEKQRNKEASKLGVKAMLGKELTYVKDVVLESDPNDLRYMFKYDAYITDNEIKTANFFKNYPAEKLDILTEQIAKAYEQGFIKNNKDMSKKSIVMLRCQVGHEELVKRLIKYLKENYNLDSNIGIPASTAPNKQLGHDLKFSIALHLDEEFTKNSIEIMKEVWEETSDVTKEYSGVIAVTKFGEKPFAPENKDAAWSLAPEQQKIYQNMMMSNSQTQQKYLPRTENSFCIISFPSPEIGDKFEAIFEDTLEINMLASERYEVIQKNIIDVLDKSSKVHIKGQNGNLTDIIIKNQKLANPSKQTNYCNCGADVNIPVGEVFTSPQLEGTNGALHIKETFLGGLKYKELNLEFKDGFISDYSCANYDDEAKNKKFIEENLIFPHKTLPIGEFAIGTNTLAYVVAQKYKILDVLPVLIIEKMGPHFAIGDTCFSHTEDMAVYNPIDNKEITARDNSMTLNRKEDYSKAYTNVHTDITLPYEDIEFITAIAEDGEKFDIIRNGRFAVAGTEELNIPLDDFGI